jgi:4-hydroxybenzoate polyprenyltransferase
MAGILKKIRIMLELIKWEHSIFALPFALAAMLLTANGLPGRWTVGVDSGGDGHGAIGSHGV